MATVSQSTKPDEADLLPGSVSRLNAFVPERIAQIEHLYHELLAQAEARHKAQVEELSTHLAQTEARYKAQVEELTHTNLSSPRRKSRNSPPTITGKSSNYSSALPKRISFFMTEAFA